ncbi:Interferon-induced protein with tetratricopeptide repeats 5 [Dissostichus eleginoides]|uniref:Interferon-induced protein with tetratricopeptide repeats 5 n=1 Tax=Dissostichus eleginoides TaxID=100907 RepID=A0AAD9FCU3_DISEL|nr:Interferon-induced protein with tetratricopeptide repeats 5 [Dissostichus eleginoides]
MQPDMVEWNSWPVLALVYASKHSRTGLEDDILEKMRIAQEQDPENLYLAAHYLDQRAQRGERIEDEAPKQKWHITDFIAADPKHQEQNHPNIYRTTDLRKQLNDEFNSGAAQTLVSRLKPLQCHFTWDLGLSRSLLLRCRDNLLDIGTENGNPWLGHIYNLRGFIQYRLGFSEDSLSFFNKAKQAFCKIRSTDEGPWLVVNNGNLAWLHHHLGDQAESEDYLLKVDALNKKYTSSSQTELHPETYAEKAYTLMAFNGDINLVADYFQRAIEMQPDMVEWNSWHVLALLYASKHSRTGLEDDIFEKMRIAQEQDPENLYLAAHYLCQCAMRGESIEDEAQEALKNHPDEPYLKRHAALCYYEKRFICSDSPPKKSMLNRAVSLHQEVLFNSYATYLHLQNQDRKMSIRCHMKAAAIPHQSFFRKNSFKVLENIRDKGRDRMCGEIRKCLANLQEP